MPSVRAHCTYLAGRVARSVPSLALLFLGVMLAMGWSTNAANADGPGGQASAYNAYRESANTCTVWSPLFQYKADGWSSTLVLENHSDVGSTVFLRLTPLGGGNVLPRATTLPANGTQQVTGAELGLPDNFSGSLTATACPVEISAVVMHDQVGGDRIAMESVEAPAADLFIPGVANDVFGVTSKVVIFNTSPNANAPLTVTYRVADGAAVERPLFVPREAAVTLDLSSAPKGFLGVQITGFPGSTLVGAVYYYRQNGPASGVNAVSSATRRVLLPVLYRKAGRDNGLDSGIRIMNLKEGRVLPRVYFYERESGSRIGPITLPSPIPEGEFADILLPQVAELEDNKVYSAIVETDSREALAAIGFTLSGRGLDFVYTGINVGDQRLSAPLVYRRAAGLDSGIEIQNLTTGSGSVAVRFFSPRGQSIATWTGAVQGNNAVTVSLPSVRGLPDGFIGSAEISSSVLVGAVVTTLRYAEDARFTQLATYDRTGREHPEGVAVDRQGNVYVGIADTGEIRRYTPDGQASRFAVIGPPATGGMLTGLAFDAEGSLYAALFSRDDNNGIWRVSAEGVVSRFAALPVAFPNGLAFDSAGNLYVSDSSGGQIWRIAPDGAASVWKADAMLRGDPTGPVAGFTLGANGVALAPDGTYLSVVVTDYGRLVRVPIGADGAAGPVQIVVEHRNLLGSDGLAVDATGRLYVAVNAQNRIVRVTPQGEMTVLAGGYPLRSPASLAFGSGANAGTLYITNSEYGYVVGTGAMAPGLVQFIPEVGTQP